MQVVKDHLKLEYCRQLIGNCWDGYRLGAEGKGRSLVGTGEVGLVVRGGRRPKSGIVGSHTLAATLHRDGVRGLGMRKLFCQYPTFSPAASSEVVCPRLSLQTFLSRMTEQGHL